MWKTSKLHYILQAIMQLPGDRDNTVRDKGTIVIAGLGTHLIVVFLELFLNSSV